ncbi:unnamed protein product, partial [Ascophyllum nodosum]
MIEPLCMKIREHYESDDTLEARHISRNRRVPIFWSMGTLTTDDRDKEMKTFWGNLRHLCVVAVTIVREGPSSTSLPLTPSYDPPFICSSSTSRRFFQHAIEVSNIVLNLIFRSGPPE